MKQGAKWGFGCGLGCLAALIGLAVLMFIGVNKAAQKAREYQALAAAERAQHVEDLKARGFVNVVRGQSITINQNITQPTLYDVQVFKLFGDCTTNLCVLAQHGEIHGIVEGDLIFEGQVLIIGSNAVVRGNVELDAQSVEQWGRIEGSVTGTYQTLED